MRTLRDKIPMVTPDKRKVLVVDDEPGIRDSLRLLLENHYQVLVAEDGDAALNLAEKEIPDLVLLDLILPKIDGIETLKALKAKLTQIPVIILTGTTTVKTAVQAMKYGAIDYLNKPFNVEELLGLISDTLQLKDARDTAVSSGAVVVNPEACSGDFGPMVGKSPQMTELFQKIKQVAERDTTVLVTGESGTGKELVAKLIHDNSSRKAGPFVPINCAAIPETLIESELFGHEKGSFTNAIDKRVGYFELADGGTLFLDEIGELSLSVQVKILRFLQEQEFYRVGKSKPIKVNVRIIAATNRNLEEAIKQKSFREDLYYRINVIGFHLPPLRDRFEDIPALIGNFVKRFSSSYKGKEVAFAQEAIDALVQYNWPGNVRELENVVESLIALSPKDQIGLEDLPDRLRGKVSFDNLASQVAPGSLGFEEAEKRFETEIILKALKKTNYVQTRAAELLGISRRILKYKMDKLGISDSPPGQQN